MQNHMQIPFSQLTYDPKSMPQVAHPRLITSLQYPYLQKESEIIWSLQVPPSLRHFVIL